jgi:quercetin dioxygenase-like cupin family protein
MCDQHVRHETWVSPINSRHLTSKHVILHPGESMPDHSTGKDREEVLTCLSGTLTVRFGKVSWVIGFSESVFIPEDTLHSIHNQTDADASYVFVVTKKKPEPGRWRGMTVAEARNQCN